MSDIHIIDLVELKAEDQQKIAGGIKIGSLSIVTSIITAESELTETKSFSIHWDESGISLQLQ